ncbi:lengsin-like [Anneissia japonica]|uniref:lengsin-like n=1 Tax=Anneissia japonica TaxID=1529436 RepID=UPI001425AFA1|nr:lengsin-like [Anneissia japonica]
MEKVLKRIQDADIEFVRFEVTDMSGISRMKMIPARHFKSKAENGVTFYAGYLAIDTVGNYQRGSGFTGELGHADVLLLPDMDTFEIIPWWENTARILLEPVLNGKEVSAAPRFIAKNQLEELKAMGYSLLSAHEYEFYAVKEDTLEPIFKNGSCRATQNFYESTTFLYQLGRDLPKVGIDIEYLETERGPGQIEIPYKPSFGIKAADIAFTFKGAVKEIAKQHGLMASFMSKPFPGLSGSSCHFNHSLWDVECKEALTFDAESPDKLSEVAKYWIAGILHHAPALTLIMGPTINCRRRFIKWKCVPTYPTWGFDNRSAAVRVKTNDESSTYLENRIGAAGSNPYLVLAATVAAGIDGIRKKLPLPPYIEGSAYKEEYLPENTARLPKSMPDAIEAFLQDDVIRDAFGEDFVKAFVSIKNYEITKSNEAEVNDMGEKWEWQTYFEYL